MEVDELFYCNAESELLWHVSPFFPGHQSFAAILERMSDNERVARLERGG